MPPAPYLVSLFGPADDAGPCESVDETAGRADVVDGPGQSGGRPQQSAERIGDDLHVHPVLLVFAGVEGPVGGDAVDRQQCPVQQEERLRRRRSDRLGEGRGEGAQDVDGLGDVAVGGGGADPEVGRELGVRMTVAEMSESEQSLPPRIQAPPSGAETTAVFPQTSSEKRRAELDTSSPDG